MKSSSKRNEVDQSRWKRQRRCKNFDCVLLLKLSLPFILYYIITIQAMITQSFNIYLGASAFVIHPNSFTGIRTSHNHKLQQQQQEFLLHQTKFLTDDDNEQSASYSTSLGISSSLSKLESKAVQRFTISYDKLCKTCPTRIQPRVDTLTEMIMGLSKDDRNELLDKIAQRMKAEKFSNVKNDKDVYTFQTGLDVDEVNNDNNEYDSKQTKKATSEPRQPLETTQNKSNGLETMMTIEDNTIKIRNKIYKSKQKYNKYKYQLIEVQHLLSFITQLLSSPLSSSLSSSKIPKVGETQDTQDNAIYHKMDELSTLPKKELKMERLKIIATKRKVEQKMAKCRMKLYGATLKLAEEKKKKMEMEVEKMRGLKRQREKTLASESCMTCDKE